MQVATLSKIRKELALLSPEELIALINQLARYKKDNKELLDYLLFASGDEQQFIADVQELISKEFETLNNHNLYWARKSIRRILRLMNKYIRYSGKTETEIELRAHFCRVLNDSGIPVHRSAALGNLYDREVDRITKALEKLHEDVKTDYRGLLEELK